MKPINEWGISSTHIDGCKVLTTKRSADPRGMFTETFVYGMISGFECRQSNVVRNEPDRIIRGIHTSPYQKLVMCPEGQIYDVCVDVRPGSPTYGKWVGHWIYASKALLIPAYCGHAYMSHGGSLVLYYQDDVWVPEREGVIDPFDKKVGIWWPHAGGDLSPDDVIMSDKDRNALSFDEFDFSCMTI